MSDPALSDASHAPADTRSTNRERVRRYLLAAIGVLYVVSVPWYRDTDAPLRIWFGLPDWVAVAVGALAVALLIKAFLLQAFYIPSGSMEPTLQEDDRVLVNELAPRPHNSGHWTIDACLVNQFEQFVRAVCGLPLGSPRRHSDAEMTNLLGDDT